MTSRLIAVALTTCSAGLVVAGCGTNTIDHKKGEKDVRSRLLAQGAKPAQIKDVSCPSGQESKKNTNYVCTATLVDGSKIKFTYKITDDKGGVLPVSATQVK